MVVPGLGLGGFGTGIKVIELLIFIIKTTEEAHHLKDECAMINDTATSLKQCLEANPQGLEGVPASSRLIVLLGDVSKFVAKCKQSNILKRAWEISWRQRVPDMIKQMMMWIAILNVEVSATTRSELLDLLAKLDSFRSQQEADTSAILDRLLILDELKKVQDQKAAGELGIDFAETNEDLDVRQESEDFLVGSLKLRGSTATQVDVICEPLKEDLMRYGEKGPRHILIYAKISARTLVHQFYGVAQRYNRRWAVMKDLRKCPSLADAIKTSQMPASTLDRIALAHQIATTVDYLHSVEVLTKRLSDKTVLLSQNGDAITPYLTELEKARLFKESSTGEQYDVRYEAIEMQWHPKPPRSIYSDIWSLGIIIWTCISATIPFDFNDETTGETDVKSVRKAIAANAMPWVSTTHNDAHLDKIMRLVASCCNPRPKTRPSATEVAASLWDIMTLPPLERSLRTSAGEEVKARISDLLDQGTESERAVAQEDVEVLRLLEAQGDPVAAYLLGLVIWRKHLEPEDDVEELFMLADTEPGQERRARSALAHLETAMRADHKGAAKYLMQVHDELGRLYQKQALQYARLQSLPKELM